MLRLPKGVIELGADADLLVLALPAPPAAGAGAAAEAPALSALRYVIARGAVLKCRPRILDGVRPVPENHHSLPRPTQAHCVATEPTPNVAAEPLLASNPKLTGTTQPSVRAQDHPRASRRHAPATQDAACPPAGRLVAALDRDHLDAGKDGLA